MLRRTIAAAAACSLLWASVASASTVTVGQLFAPTVGCNGSTQLQTSVASGTSYIAPAPGVITAWSFEAGGTTVSGLKLKVGRGVGAGRYMITGDAVAGAQVPNELNTYPADIAVQAGDVIGLYGAGGTCLTPIAASDALVFVFGDQPSGSTGAYSPFGGDRLDVSAQITLQPGVTLISPPSGTGGTAVRIAGDDFTGATSVLFGGVPASSFTVNSDTSVTAVAPVGPAGTVDVTVTTPGGRSPTSSGDLFTYMPSISAISPASGPTTGGTAVSISGHAFSGATSVEFGSVNATSFKVNSDSSVTATSPAAIAGTVDVTVVAPGGQSEPTLVDRFTFVDVCVVPDLKGKKLRAATKALNRAHCALGRVKPKGHRTGRVKHQSRRPGTVLPAGTKVTVRLD